MLITHHAQADNIYVLSPTSPTPLSSHQQPVNTNQIAFCWSGERIFVTTSEGKIRILSYPEFEPILRVPYGEQEEFQLTGHTSSCLTAELQPIGRYLATGGADSIIALWDTQEWICQRTIVSMVGSVKSISTLWRYAPPRILILSPLSFLLTIPSHPIPCMPRYLVARLTSDGTTGFTFDGSFVVGGSDEGSGLEVTHAETGEKVHTFRTAGSCPVVAWAPTRYWLAYSDLGVLRIAGIDADKK